MKSHAKPKLNYYFYMVVVMFATYGHKKIPEMGFLDSSENCSHIISDKTGPYDKTLHTA